MAAEKAKAATDAKREAEKRTKFEGLINKRVGKVIAAVSNIATMANTHNYTFTSADVDKVKKAITKSLDETLARFVDALNGKTPAAKTAGFDINKS